MPTTKYELGTTEAELERLREQSKFLSENAARLFDRFEIQPGWRALDVACGPLGVLEVLADRVGSEGKVVGLDTNLAMVEQARAFAATAGRKNIEIVHGNAADPRLPQGTFDLVHARLLIVNLPFAVAQKVVSQMVSLAKPGGLVVLQDIDAGTFSCDPPHPGWDKLFGTFVRFLTSVGSNEGSAGRLLPRLLREAGTADIQVDAHATFCPPGHPWRNLVIHFSDVTREGAITRGLANAADLDAAKAALSAHLDNPETTVLGPVLAQAWGRRPAQA